MLVLASARGDPSMTLPGRRRQLAEQLFIACSEVGGMAKTPTCGSFHNQCVRFCYFDVPAHGVEALRSQISYGAHTQSNQLKEKFQHNHQVA